MLEDFSSNVKAALTARGTTFALNLTVRCCGREFRVLNGYDQKEGSLSTLLVLEANVFPDGNPTKTNSLEKSTLP
ncbi:hypothetical protein Tco_1006903 [Tanacetum coccineum]|uniref:Uncharacterized protein n=1 Tax=Tanacetum coccineum TaxID=301880 RepID=A0ABQ5FJ92_9ASTR